jgi:isoleucyl-tRNA synthetase
MERGTEMKNEMVFVAFTIRQAGCVGPEILEQGGKIVAWTTDDWTAQVICKLLNENEELMREGVS